MLGLQVVISTNVYKPGGKTGYPLNFNYLHAYPQNCTHLSRVCGNLSNIFGKILKLHFMTITFGQIQFFLGRTNECNIRECWINTYIHGSYFSSFYIRLTTVINGHIIFAHNFSGKETYQKMTNPWPLYLLSVTGTKVTDETRNITIKVMYIIVSSKHFD